MAAIDATGLETRHVSFHYRYRYSEAYRRALASLPGDQAPKQDHWRARHPKLTAAVHAASHLIAGALPGWGPSHDSPGYVPVLQQAATLLRLVAAVADSGFDAEANHRFSRETLGLEQTAIALNPRRWGGRCPRTPYRRQMHRAFPRALYRKRMQVESVFSQHKRRLGDALTARSPATQLNEMLLRVLTHNLLILYCVR